MTEDQRYALIVRLKCCSANWADCISKKLRYGGSDDFRKLMILNGLLELIVGYNVTDDAPNCITEDEFDEVVIKAKNICNLCDCDN